MIEWGEAVEAAAAAFVEELERRGFANRDGALTGAVAVDGGSVGVVVRLTEAFPFEPPKVVPPENVPRSWHRERDGAMCLYPNDGWQTLPWLDVDDLLDMVKRWLHESSAGWRDDTPDLDLERYFPSAPDGRLVVYGDLDDITDAFIQLRHKGRLTCVAGRGSIPTGTKGMKADRAFGYVADIGEPSAPPASWAELSCLLDGDIAHKIESAIRQRRLTHLIVRYSRRGTPATLALLAHVDPDGGISLAALSSASAAPVALQLRAGAAAGALARTRVAVVGAGAIGSFLCDLLARSGVGHLTVYDGDIVRPGNLVRHLAADYDVGLSKPHAVRRAVTARSFNVASVDPVAQRLRLPTDVLELFGSHDLVVDASAAGGVTDMLAAAARISGRRLVSVCLQEEGRVVRVDVIPLLDGEPVPATVLGPPPSVDELRFEAGCGDPVSQTPPFAVLEAAALAARCAIGILTGDQALGRAGVMRDYR